MKISDPTLQISHFEPKYKCCCGTVHVKQGSLLVGITSLFLALIVLASTFVGRESTNFRFLELASTVIDLLCIILLLVGVRQEMKTLLIPFIIYQIVQLILCFALLFVCIWSLFDSKSPAAEYMREATLSTDERELEVALHKETQTNMMTTMAAIFLCMALLITIIVTSWFGIVVYKCYVYFRDLEAARAQSDVAVKYDSSGRTVIAEREIV